LALLAVAVLLAQVDLPGLGQEGPDELRTLLTTAFVLMSIGFFVALLGHITQIRTLVAAGIALVFVGTIFFLLAVGEYG
jgi:hypothetical protein